MGAAASIEAEDETIFEDFSKDAMWFLMCEIS
jgi:hypothetical protein